MAWHAVTAARKVTTQEAMASGKAVIDCGAAKSLGSVRALENLTQLSSHGVCQMDTQDRPVFGFGNSSEDRCVSTLHLKIRAGEKPGVMKIHALDRGSGPVLLSVATLKALGAILDFSDGTMVGCSPWRSPALDISSFPLQETFLKVLIRPQFPYLVLGPSWSSLGLLCVLMVLVILLSRFQSHRCHAQTCSKRSRDNSFLIRVLTEKGRSAQPGFQDRGFPQLKPVVRVVKLMIQFRM